MSEIVVESGGSNEVVVDATSTEVVVDSGDVHIHYHAGTPFIVLSATDPVPVGTPDGTLIIRTSL